ncbi:pentapeptide repeat-containing protein [Caulobacter sp. NIBR1757]|uniref:pentapeptide repeat-containing protein n=1 Tax=Caulobacter sp. NIBR1757 TaxID=3016000 RepID=UPI0022F0B07C|nr:pentapeptide repeat-containing protein [Caulobacter sp. NIBR1757]WGM39465.1 hypothetical protein AMEJIAPC_02385 [Caulobacter sp. NIBR1757]
MADADDLDLLFSGASDLSKCDFRSADLSGIDLRGRNLDGCLFAKANLTGANLSGMRLPGVVLSQTDLSGADLSGADLSTAQMIKTNFQGANLKAANFTASRSRGGKPTGAALYGAKFDRADLRGADFRGVSMNEECTLDDVVVDENTLFDGVKLLRALSRLPAFTMYSFERGELVQRTASGVEAAELRSAVSDIAPPSSSDLDGLPAVDSGPDSVHQAGGTTLATGVREVAVALTERLKLDLTAISAIKPNDPDALNLYERYVELMDHVIEQLQLVVSLLGAAEQAGDLAQKQQVVKSRAILNDLGAVLTDWAKQNGRATLKAGISVGGVALATLAMTQLGVSPNIAVGISTAFFGGSEVVTAVGNIASAASSKKGAAE